MNNLELSQIFYQMADLLEMQEVEFKPRAYEKAARVLETKKEDVSKVYNREGLEGLKKIPGVGESIAKSIEEYLNTGVIEDYERLKKQAPVDIDKLSSVEGLGPRTIKKFYKELNIKSVEDLEKAAKKGKIRKLEGFGEKSEKNILESIEFLKEGGDRVLLGRALPMIRDILKRLKENKEVKKAEIAGSARRMKETVGDIDILASSSDPKKTMDFFVNMPEVVKIWNHGKTKSSVRLKDGLDCDLRIVEKNSFGAALQYFTGSKDHNIIVRRIAIEKGYKLNEYGLFKKSNEKIAGENEKEVYNALGLSYIPPEIRTNKGEIKAAQNDFQGKQPGLPKLLNYNQILGDTQCHTNWSDGANTLEEMAEAAKRTGYEYLVITDHAGMLKIANALDEDRLIKQMKEIDRINQKMSGFRLIKSCEVDIEEDGSLAIKDEILEKLEIVSAAIHSKFKMPEKEMTKRVIRAIENPNVDVIVHPTARVIQKREPIALNMEEVFKAAKANNVALEVNSHIDRLDLNAENVRRAVEKGVKLTIGTDAHSFTYFPMIELGVATARRGWAEAKDVLNTRSLNDFLDFFNKK